MKIKICTYPRKILSISHDIEIIKSILLYADEIELVSPNAAMLFSIMMIPYIEEKEKIKFITEIFPIIDRDEKNLKNLNLFISEYERLSKKKRKVGDDLKIYLMIKKGLDESWKILKDGIEERFDYQEFKLLEPLIDNQILKINTIIKNEEDLENDKFCELMQENIQDSINNENYYPLFDEDIGNLARAMAKEGYIQISDIDKSRSTHVGITSNLLSRLPQFGDLSIDELIDLRKDLNKYLVRFKSAMIEYSDIIETLPWDKDFKKECEKIEDLKILPEILNIEECVKSNKYLKKLVTTITSEPLTTSSATGLGLLITQLSALPTLANISLGFASGSAIALGKSFSSWKRERNDIERNKLFFYYKAKNKLDKRVKAVNDATK